jgi:hypothetical protein
MKPEYREGPEAQKKFEDTLQNLFRVPKAEVVKPKPTKDEAKEESEK